MQPYYCSHCGAMLNENDHFCAQCGTLIGQNIMRQSTVSKPIGTQSKIIWGVGIIAIVIGFLIMGSILKFFLTDEKIQYPIDSESSSSKKAWDTMAKKENISTSSNQEEKGNLDYRLAASFLPEEGLKKTLYFHYMDGTQGTEYHITGKVQGSSVAMSQIIQSEGQDITEGPGIHYLLNTDGVYYYFDADPMKQEYIMLKNPLEVGAQWDQVFSEGTIHSEILEVERSEIVPAGTFQHCILVREDNEMVGVSVNKIYAPKKGLIAERAPVDGYELMETISIEHVPVDKVREQINQYLSNFD